ncbi:MAG: hypothetical protein MJZ19_09450 [Paludibacteraceae bacterium]|nr:hypothetical protein [Paludibacteraceae bacterium]
MDIFLEIVKISVSGILVLLCSYLMLKQIVRNDEKRMRHQTRIENGKLMTPLKLTAYERLSLFLERIKPESMIIRIQTPTMTAGQLHDIYIMQVREEFEHNISQQIYVSEDLWRYIVSSKEGLLQFINTCSSKVPHNVPAIELSRLILETYSQVETSPVDMALQFLNSEVKRLS